VLALAAYNASPRRAVEWVKRFGDPRDSEIDPVDWIESIPFEETRFYIQKVLQNTQVYRSRLQESAARGLLADLTRGRAAVATRTSEQAFEACDSRSNPSDQLVPACR
jgi:soluble lytic murein transglycosylase